MRSKRVILLVLFRLALFAAGDKGEISGTVFDPQGKPRPGTPVQAKNTRGEAMFRATSGANGEYTISGLAPGSYDVTSNVLGLNGSPMRGVQVEKDRTVRVDLKLTEADQLSTLGEDVLAIEAHIKMDAPPSGPTPRTVDGRPDFSGVWWSPRATGPVKREFLPAAQEIADKRMAMNNRDSPQAHCLPSAATRIGPLWEFVQSKAVLVMISDDNSPGFHQIYLDGRPHPQDLNPAWYGHNIGRWEGDTLVVDRVAFDERVYLDQAHSHSDKLHIVERYRRPDLGHIEAEVTVDDPGVLVRAYSSKWVADLAPGQEISEFICQENNRDVEHLVGK